LPKERKMLMDVEVRELTAKRSAVLLENLRTLTTASAFCSAMVLLALIAGLFFATYIGWKIFLAVVGLLFACAAIGSIDGALRAKRLAFFWRKVEAGDPDISLGLQVKFQFYAQGQEKIQALLADYRLRASELVSVQRELDEAFLKVRRKK